MSSVLFINTATASSSPLRRSCNLSGKGIIRSLNLGITKSSLCHTSCKLQQGREGKDHGVIIDRRNVLIGLGSLCAAAASSVVDKGSVAKAGYATAGPQTLLDEEDKAENSSVQPVPEFGPNPRPLNTPIRAIVERPKKKEDTEEVLVVYGVDIPNDDAVRFDVYVDKPVYGDGGLIMDDPNDYGEMAGSMVDLAHTRVGRKAPNGSLNLGISELIEDIEAEDSNNLVVTLVPRSGQVIIGGVRIENWDYDE